MAVFKTYLNLPWPTSSINSITTSLSSIYGLMTISIYVVVLFSKFSKNFLVNHLEVEACACDFLLYMLVMACSFLIYLLLYLVKPACSHSSKKSHGSAFLRQGATVFGIGTCLYFGSTFISHVINYENIELVRIVNNFFALVFAVLQMLTIVLYPRLNIDLGFGMPHFGLMHVVSTNLIIWIKTVIKESVLEFNEINHHSHFTNNSLVSEHHHHFANYSLVSEHHHHYSHFTNTSFISDHHSHFSVVNSSIYSPISAASEYILSFVRKSSPILFPFIVEFSLIGATFFYNMWQHVSPYNSLWPRKISQVLEKPSLTGVLVKTDWTHCAFGGVLGLIIALVNIVTMEVLFQVPCQEVVHVVDEYVLKVVRCATNSCAILATLIGVVQVQKFVDKIAPEDSSMDVFLLNVGGTSSFVYMFFTIVVGVLTNDAKDVPGSLHVVNGVLDVGQITLQIVLINLLMKKVVKSVEDGHPGRQSTTFLAFFNFTMWLVNTFELPKSTASLSESQFFGPMTWVWLQRLTLPLTIFFRFHSTVVLIDCWKNSYKTEAADGSG